MRRLWSTTIFALTSMVVSCSLTLLPARVNAEPVSLDAIELQAKTSRDFDRAMQQLQAFIRREPGNAKAYMIAGQMLEARGYGSLAEQMYKQADRCDPAGPNSNLQIFYLKLHEEGAQAAAQYLGYLAERFPDDPNVLLMEGMISRMHRHYPEARFYYERVAQLHPQTPGVYAALASLEMINHNYAKALELLNQELKLHPGDPSASVAKGQVLLLTGKPSEAIEPLKRAYQFDTSSVLVERRLVADLLMTACSHTPGKNADALEYGMQVLASTKTSDDVAMASIKRKLRPLLRGVPQNEILNIEAVVENMCGKKKESLATLRFGLADILEREGLDVAATTLFRRGLELMPTASRGNYRLGAALIKNRDYANGYLYVRQAYLEDQYDRAIVNTYVRLNSRLNNRGRDIGWRLKDWLHGGCVTELDGMQTLMLKSSKIDAGCWRGEIAHRRPGGEDAAGKTL